MKGSGTKEFESLRSDVKCATIIEKRTYVIYTNQEYLSTNFTPNIDFIRDERVVQYVVPVIKLLLLMITNGKNDQ